MPWLANIKPYQQHQGGMMAASLSVAQKLSQLSAVELQLSILSLTC